MRSSIGPGGRRPLAIAAGIVVIGGILAGYALARRHPSAPRETAGAEFFARPQVASDIVTYAPVFNDLDVLRGDGDLDFTTLTDAQWALLLQEKTDGRSPQ